MGHIFCTNCGSKNLYASVKPKFCQSCGHSTSIFTNNDEKIIASSKPVEEEEGIPSLSKLEYEIDSGSKRKLTLASLFDNPMNPEDVSPSASLENHNVLSIKEYAEKSKALCGSARQPTNIEGE